MNTQQISQSTRSKHVEQADSKQLDNRYEARYKTRDRCPQTNQINHISAYPSSRFLSRPLFHVFASSVTRNSSHSCGKAIEKNFDESRRNDYSKQFAILWELPIPLRFSRFSSSLLSLFFFFFLRANASSSSEDRKGRFTPAN